MYSETPKDNTVGRSRAEIMSDERGMAETKAVDSHLCCSNPEATAQEVLQKASVEADSLVVNEVEVQGSDKIESHRSVLDKWELRHRRGMTGSGSYSYGNENVAHFEG